MKVICFCLGSGFRCCEGHSHHAAMKSKEIWRLRVNFFVLLVLLLTSIGYISPLVSLHQFVTNPTLEEQNGTQMVPPGLGKSEFFYSWTVAVYSIGEVTFALVYACLFHVVPYTYIFMSLIMSYILGSLFYAVASSGWMILIARFLVGGCCVVGESAFYVYIADRELEYEKAYAAQNDVHDADKEWKGQKLKERMYAYRVLLIGTANLIGTGFSVLAAHVGGANQFHWIGWFNVAVGGGLLIVLVALFRGECEWKKPEMKCMTTKWSSMKSNKLKQGLIGIVVLLFFTFATYATESSYGVVDTLFNPILSDYFGLTEREISYYFVGLMLAITASSLLLIVIQKLKINSRIIAMLGVMILIVGAALIADWQAIGYDPCTQFSLFHHPELTNKSKPGAICLDNYGLTNLEAHINISNNTNHFPCANVTLLRTVCESLGDTKYHCYWNQHSRVTGEECHACPSICRSEYKSLTLAQFVVGSVLFQFGIPVTRTALMIMIASNLSTGIRSVFIGIVNALGGLSRIVTPIWIDIAYEAMGKRTFLAMGVMVGCSLLVLAGLIGLYTKIAPQKESEDQSTGHETERDPEYSVNGNESAYLIELRDQKHVE